MKAPIIMEGAGKDDGMEHRDALAETATAVIREKSAAAQLVSASEIMLILQERLAPIDLNITNEIVTVLLTRLILENEDLHTLGDADPQWYYSSRSITEAYAKILLQTLEGPVRLIAETVRQNSRTYHRPVPLEFFEKPPFNLACHQVLDCLETMAATEGYEDIATTTTSASGVYLYSSTYLETEHAVMLAEWFDVGQSENP